jgi:hypothetical protein
MFIPYLSNPKPQHLLFSAALAAAVWSVADVARADSAATVIALDMDFAAPVTDADTDPGGGGALRLGRKYSLVLLSLTPEVGLGYHQFGGDSDATLYRAFVGGRIGVGKIIEPSAFVHLGIGKLDLREGDRFSPVADAGLALDFTLLPLLNLGVHGAYNTVLPRSPHDAFGWFSAGLHAALVW